MDITTTRSRIPREQDRGGLGEGGSLGKGKRLALAEGPMDEEQASLAARERLRQRTGNQPPRPRRELAAPQAAGRVELLVQIDEELVDLVGLELLVVIELDQIAVRKGRGAAPGLASRALAARRPGPPEQHTLLVEQQRHRRDGIRLSGPQPAPPLADGRQLVCPRTRSRTISTRPPCPRPPWARRGPPARSGSQARGDYDQALSWYQQSIDIIEELGNRAGMLSSYHQLGNVLYLRGDYDQALSCWRVPIKVERSSPPCSRASGAGWARRRRRAPAARLLLEEERQLFEVDAEVDVLQGDAGAGLDADGGGVEDAADGVVGEGGVVVLRELAGDGEDADHRSGFAHDLRQVGGVADGEAGEGAADLARIVVHSGDDVEGAVVEAEVAGEGAAEVAHADDDHRVIAVEAEERVEVLGELGDLVADAADAELAELGEVLADLGRRQVIAPRHLLRGDARETKLLQLAQAAEVEREAVEGERGDLLRLPLLAVPGPGVSPPPVGAVTHCRRPAGQRPSTSVASAAITAAARPQPSMSRPSGCRRSGRM